MVTRTRTGGPRDAPEATAQQEEHRGASGELAQDGQRRPREPVSRAQFEELMKTMATLVEKVDHLTAKQRETEEPEISKSSRPRRTEPEASKASWSEGEEDHNQKEEAKTDQNSETKGGREGNNKGPAAKAPYNNSSPFTKEVLAEPLPPKFRMPMIDQYNGTTDPTDHVETYRSIMTLHQVPDEIMCRAFPPTLKGPARVWCSRLPRGSIGSFDQLSTKFVSHFISKRKHQKTSASLMGIVQARDEPLRSYVDRFNNKALDVEDLDQSVALAAMISGVHPQTDFFRSLARTPPATFSELLAKAEKYINAEETVAARRDPNREKRGEKRRERESPRREFRQRQNENRRDIPTQRRRQRSPPRFDRYTPLTTSRKAILMEIKGDNYIRWPEKLKTSRNKRDQGKYCRFHKDYGHDTEDCRHLKEEIESLIQRGYLKRFVHDRQQREDRPSKLTEERTRNLPTAGVINTIAGGLAAGGTTSASRKAYARQVFSVMSPSKKSRTEQIISFSEDDLEGVRTPHDDAVVVTMTLANYEVKRILIDNGSSADILYYEAFEKMKLGAERLKPVDAPLYGFSGQQVRVEGSIELPLTAGSPPFQKTIMINFLVVKLSSAYNAIIGRPGLNMLGAIVSTPHLKMKFPTPQGIGEVRGDQKTARACYLTAVKGKVKETLQIDIQDLRDEVKQQRGKPVEDLEPVPLYEGTEQMIYLGSTLDRHIKEKLVTFLRANADVFAWSAEDMPGIDPHVSSHKLSVDPTKKPVKQKKRSFAPERQAAIEEEVSKLLKADFIREIDYPEWVANVVMVKKANGKWRICIDFTDLNKACPKDSYPLPRIDLLIDATSGHELLSFMDAFSGYNQIRMYEPDVPKTSFITDRGLYCYKVMPFGLKNAGATYQRLVNKIFKEQIGRNMEVYVDDMLVKSLKAEHHIEDLKETFSVLREHKMRLNPAKCAFGVTAGKFLGFMVSQRGIEANPEKIKAVLDMEAPKTVKEVQKLTGRVAALSRFMSKSAEKCLPFFKALRSPKSFEWTEDCQKSFEELKKYLNSPPLLTKPRHGEELFLYLAASSTAISAVLVREEEKSQKPIYYTSKILRGAETRYQKIEKLAYALVIAARKLRPYFQAHSIIVLTDQPLRRVLHKPESSGRLINWSVELGEFDIYYKPRPAIKAQVLADFVVETTITGELNHQEELPTWTLSVDGSSNLNGSGAGIILEGPDDVKAEYALRFKFKASNNEAEYEALIAGLNLALEAQAKRIEVLTDSQLVVGQVSGEYEAREPRMAKYLLKVKKISSRFEEFNIRQVPRSENVRADALSKLASTGTLEGNGRRAIFVEELVSPNIGDEEILQVEQKECWMDPIINYLKEGDPPREKEEARKIALKAAKYTMIGEDLYKRSYSLPLLRCLRPEEADYALREVHEGICGNHLGGRALAHKILRQGYYWPTMQTDAANFVKSCEPCQKFASVPRQPPTSITPVGNPLPFAMWGMDILGPFPISSGQRKFLIVAIDYFTKWVEAEPLATIAKRNVKDFFWKSIICRFGIPRILVTDNGTQFNNQEFKGFCEELSIDLRFTSVGHPQANGQAEAMNKTLLQGISKRLNQARALWVDELPSVLWAYRTNTHSATGESPFNLAFGTEAVIPVEIGLPSHRVQTFNQEKNEECLRSNLDAIEETRERARTRIASYQQRFCRYYNSRTSPRSFQNNDLVLRRSEVSDPRNTGKLQPKWEGPYRIIEVTRPGSYRLETLEGKTVPRSWNAANLRKFYQ